MAIYSRPSRIARGKGGTPPGRGAAAAVRPELFEKDEERALWAAQQAAAAAAPPGAPVAAFLAASEALAAPVDAFFTNVFVMAEDPAVRANRLALVAAVAGLPAGVLDFSQLPGF